MKVVVQVGGKRHRLRPLAEPVLPWQWTNQGAALWDVPLRDLTSLGLAAAGTAFGSEWQGEALLLCTEGHAAAALKGALVAGLSEVGCPVFDGGEAFLAKSAYLTAQSSAMWGVHLSDAGLHLLDADGNDVPYAVWEAAEHRLTTADIRGREPYEWTLPKPFLPQRTYSEWLREKTARISPQVLDIRGERAVVACLWEALRPLGCTTGDDGLRLRLLDGGRRLAVHTSEIGYIDAERLRALLTLVDHEPSHADGLETALCLLSYLSESGETLVNLNRRLPVSVRVYRTAIATPETGEALRRFEADELDNEGVRVVKSGGEIRVKPLSRGGLLSILAEAVSTEIAAELCDDMIARLCVIPLDN